MMMRRAIIAVLVVSTLAIITAAPLYAFNMTEKVVVANSLVLISRTSAGGFDAQQRITAMNERLIPILSYEVLTPNHIRLRKFGGETGIFVGNRLLTTVTKADAHANMTTVPKLARAWLHNARLALPEARPYANIYLTR